jgi:formylglycine-generating enzyme required for sulfatase activity
LRGEATADARGFITLGAVSDYVAQSVHGWVARNRPALDRRAVQQPWFKGPKIAEQIPLAVDPGIRARLGAFKSEVAQTVDGLRTKINRKGEFNLQVYDRLAEALEKAEDDEAGRKLLQHSKDFLSGKISEDLFVAFLERTLETPEQRQARQRLAKIASLLATAQANDNKENGKTALAALDELLRLDPAHRVAFALRAKISAYYGPSAGDTKTLDLGRGAKLELVWIPPGEFMMGEDSTAHRVKLTKGFWMGKYEVTQEQYEAVVGSNPSYFKGANNPVEQVSWHDAVAFCNKVGGRLPTEAEWEYACRAGTTTKYHSGDTDSDLARVAWYDGNSGNTTHAVGGKQANAWGLHDMHGNVWEWCADWYGDYPKGDVTDPVGPSSGSRRVLRGGSWLNTASYCRSAHRGRTYPSNCNYYCGVRVVVVVR